jgi:hypothetical protein
MMNLTGLITYIFRSLPLGGRLPANPIVHILNQTLTRPIFSSGHYTAGFLEKLYFWLH